MNHFLQEEETLQFEQFTNEDALQLGLTLIALAKEHFAGRGVAVHIERNRQPLFTHMMEGTALWNADWFLGKKNVVDHFNHSSMFVSNMFEENQWSFADVGLLDEKSYRPVGGSFPIIVKHVGVVGTVTVAGLSGDEDHELAVSGVRHFLSLND